MLARIAHELYWIGRSLARAEHTARMLDGLFHEDVQGRRADTAGVRLTWDSMLVIMGLELGAASTDRDDVVRRLTLDRGNPASVVSCIAQAREGARTVRDVFSGEMWEAINTMQLGLVSDASDAFRTGPYSVYAYIRERCGQFWGVTERTMLRDEAYAFLQAGARIEAADMTLRMLRVALPAAESRQREDAEALALLQAVGGLPGLPAPGAAPAQRAAGDALPALRERVPGLGGGLGRHAAGGADLRRRARPHGRPGAAAAAADRRSRVPLARGRRGAGRRHDARHRPARARARGRRHRRPVLRPQRGAAAARSLTGRMRFAIHYLTEYRYDEPVTDNLNVLRVTPAATPTQEPEDFRVTVDPEARLHRHADYFGTQVVEYGITRPHEHMTIDVRARVTTTEPPAPLGGGWAALGEPAYRSAGAEYLLPEPVAGRWGGTLAELRRRDPGRDARRDRCARCAS